MWCRYGTPTGRSGSGTVEEFERAKARYDADPSSVRVMMYFKDEAISPSHIDLAQLTKVNEFRESLGSEGALYWTFRSVEEFGKLVHVHLTRQAQEWKAQLQRKTDDDEPKEPTKRPIQTSDAASEHEEELGLLELPEVFEGQFESLVEISDRLNAAIEDLGVKINRHVAELASLPKDANGSVNRKDAKRIISKTSSDMYAFTARLEAEIPLFSRALNAGMKAVIRFLSLLAEVDVDEVNIKQANSSLQSILELHATMGTTADSIKEFRKSALGLPRLTGEFIKAKRAVVAVLDQLIAELDSGKLLLREAESNVRSFVRDKNA